MGDWGRRGSTALGRRSERLCIRVRWRMERGTEGSRRPSLIKSGNIEKVATVMNQGMVGLVIRWRLLGRARTRVEAPLSFANSGMLRL